MARCQRQGTQISCQVRREHVKFLSFYNVMDHWNALFELVLSIGGVIIKIPSERMTLVFFLLLRRTDDRQDEKIQAIEIQNLPKPNLTMVDQPSTT